MNVQELKTYIYNNNYSETILCNLGCGNIKHHGDYLTASNPDGGDNKQAIVLYLSENLTCIDYTRNLINTNRTTDIFDLISYFKDCNFFKSLKWVCDIVGLDYYSETPEEVCDSLQILQLIKSMSIGDYNDDNTPLKPINEKQLEYYLPYPNKLWLDDGISLRTQNEFGVRYDDSSNRIILPLYDSLNQLVGLKGRVMKPTKDLFDWEQKYLYMTKFNKSKFLFGLNKTYSMIEQQNCVFVFESEKSVMLAYEHGIGATAICGCKFSSTQIEMLTRMNVPIIICLDKDRSLEDVKYEANKFMEQVSVMYMYDTDDLLEQKQSPIDDWDKFITLRKNNVYKHERKEN